MAEILFPRMQLFLSAGFAGSAEPERRSRLRSKPKGGSSPRLAALELGHLPHAHEGQTEGLAALHNECERLQAGHGRFLDIVLGFRVIGYGRPWNHQTVHRTG